VTNPKRVLPFERPAECNSAIQQIANLRYAWARQTFDGWLYSKEILQINPVELKSHFPASSHYCMKKLILIALVLGGMASATYAGVNVSVGIGVPFPHLPVPVVVSHPPVYAAPVVVAPPVCAPPVVTYAPPVVTYYPAPRVYNYGYYRGSAGYHYDHHDYRGHNDWRYDRGHGGYCR
jgi:hypothetical protein